LAARWASRHSGKEVAPLFHDGPSTAIWSRSNYRPQPLPTPLAFYWILTIIPIVILGVTHLACGVGRWSVAARTIARRTSLYCGVQDVLVRTPPCLRPSVSMARGSSDAGDATASILTLRSAILYKAKPSQQLREIHAAECSLLGHDRKGCFDLTMRDQSRAGPALRRRPYANHLRIHS
jgi:hypothetical protein